MTALRRTKGACGPRCQGRCIASGWRQSRYGRRLNCEPPIPREESPPPPHTRGKAPRTTLIVGHGATIHGVECYEAWRDGDDCPHEVTQ